MSHDCVKCLYIAYRISIYLYFELFKSHCFHVLIRLVNKHLRNVFSNHFFILLFYFVTSE